MKITRLEVTDFKRIFAVDITPEGNVIIVGGENKAGKSSTLDSIESGLRGKRSFPGKPIRDGADKATIRITLTPAADDELERALIATRVITESRQYFEVKYEDGSTPAGTPQAIMDDLLGEVAFEFMEFLNLKPKAQLDLLKKIVGLDFTEVDTKRERIYNDRRDLNRDIERIKGAIALLDVPPDTPDKPVDVDELMAELKAGQEHNRQNQDQRTRLTEIGKEWTDIGEKKVSVHTEIERLKAQLKLLIAEQDKVRVEGEELKKVVDGLEEQILEPIEAKISASNETNIAVHKKQDKVVYQEEYDDLTQQSKDITNEITAIDDKKAADIAGADFPVPGLGFGEGVVMFNDFPLDQASDAEQIEVGIGIGASLHPKLAVMLIRKGEKITPTTMKDVIVPLAEKHGLQLFIEDCRAGKEATLIIEAGRVKETDITPKERTHVQEKTLPETASSSPGRGEHSPA